MFWVYVLRSKKDGKLYTGFTDNPKRRFSQHNGGKVVSTKNRGGLVLIYLEGCLNKVDAIRREKYLKSGRGKVFLKRRLKYWYGNKVNE